MRKHRDEKISTLDRLFKFQDVGTVARVAGWDAQLQVAIGREDGEPYLLRVFNKTGTALDGDLRRIVDRGLRRIRRITSARRAREVLVEVVDLVDDKEEFAIVMRDPGSPLRAGSQRALGRKLRLLAPSERTAFWNNITRVAEALTFCHDAGVIHGAVSALNIFSHRDDDLDYRLGGYESCVHIADPDSPEVNGPHGIAAVSFRQDWVDLSSAIAEILGLKDDRAPTLLPVEVRLLDRLARPPDFQRFDGHVVLEELKSVVNELSTIKSNVGGQLILYPARDVKQSDLASLTAGTIEADDVDALFKFVERDLSGDNVRVDAGKTSSHVVTDLAVYRVRHVTPTVGSITHASLRRREDHAIFDATEIVDRLRLVRNRTVAEETALKLGAAARPWSQIGAALNVTSSSPDVPSWHALILLEAFSLLREQYRIYPVSLYQPADQPGILLAVPQDDQALDSRRDQLGLPPAAEALRRELARDDGLANWTISKGNKLGSDRERRPELSYEGPSEFLGRRAFEFAVTNSVSLDQYQFLRPRRDGGFERAIARRLQNIVSARNNTELLRALDSPAQVALDDAVREVAKPGAAPPALDTSKRGAWESISAGKFINVVVGPPGVGKTYLISMLVRSIFEVTPDARILVSAQNHDTLIHMERELRPQLAETATIIVRVEKTDTPEQESQLWDASASLLRGAASAAQLDPIMAEQHRQIVHALEWHDDAEKQTSERVFRDTQSLLLRSADLTLATTSSYVIEEMIAEGEQFDWIIVEEAARANGAELVGALLLGNRRLLIGDHNQLSPFDAKERQKFYTPARAQELLRTARSQLEAISDLPGEVEEAISLLTSDPALLSEVLPIAARMEEPFRAIADQEEEKTKLTGRASSIVNTLYEQSRMHPQICELVSNTFYQGKLTSSDRVRARPSTITCTGDFPSSPVVVLDFPALSVTKTREFERYDQGTFSNKAEAVALIAALEHLRPISSDDKSTIAILAPYTGQVKQLQRLIKPLVHRGGGRLCGFMSPRDDGAFVFTSDSFQGSEADVVLASLVRNNVSVGPRAVGFMRTPQRLNVLLSRARQKLVLATSLKFIEDAANGKDPDALGGELGFLRVMIRELKQSANSHISESPPGVSIIRLDEHGRAVK